MTTNDLLFDFLPYSQFIYWFIPVTHNEWAIYQKDPYCAVGHVTIDENEHDPDFYLHDILTDYDVETVRADWLKYVSGRPEFAVGRPVFLPSVINDIALADVNSSYEKCLCGSSMLAGVRRSQDAASANPDDYIPFKCLEWLRKTDFYTAPASSKYHDATVGGLCIHSLRVMNQMLELRKMPIFKQHVPEYKAVRCALVHDWCKIGCYESYLRNVQDPATGTWSKVPSYRRKESMTFSLGHGVSSLFAAQQFFRLSMEEALAIRWHMGEYNIANNEMDELHQSNHTYPLVYMLQFADRLSCTDYVMNSVI